MKGAPLEDQKPSHKYTFVECLLPAAAACQDAQKEWLYGKLSLQLRHLLYLLSESAANHYQAQVSAKHKYPLLHINFLHVSYPNSPQLPRLSTRHHMLIKWKDVLRNPKDSNYGYEAPKDFSAKDLSDLFLASEAAFSDSALSRARARASAVALSTAARSALSFASIAALSVNGRYMMILLCIAKSSFDLLIAEGVGFPFRHTSCFQLLSSNHLDFAQPSHQDPSTFFSSSGLQLKYSSIPAGNPCSPSFLSQSFCSRKAIVDSSFFSAFLAASLASTISSALRSKGQHGAELCALHPFVCFHYPGSYRITNTKKTIMFTFALFRVNAIHCEQLLIRYGSIQIPKPSEDLRVIELRAATIVQNLSFIELRNFKNRNRGS
ncbi:Auxilin-like protein 1 [Senna tora]|uniref:Auxilin-like protein 1 n=1 Tax=Senna tora TaxID=362788 RepID=A0A834T9G4_9FABA|nr:Auxilin-like protein 1 [Senna tora]